MTDFFSVETGLKRFVLVVASTFCLLSSPASAAEDYQLGPDSMVQEGVPQGTVTKLQWKSDKVFAGRRMFLSVTVFFPPS